MGPLSKAVKKHLSLSVKSGRKILILKVWLLWFLRAPGQTQFLSCSQVTMYFFSSENSVKFSKSQDFKMGLRVDLWGVFQIISGIKFLLVQNKTYIHAFKEIGKKFMGNDML